MKENFQVFNIYLNCYLFLFKDALIKMNELISDCKIKEEYFK